MPADTQSLSCHALWTALGHAHSPRLIDVRTAEDFDADPRLLPGAERADWRTIEHWRPDWPGGPVVVYCQGGLKLSQGAAALLRWRGIRRVDYLEGGFGAWRDGGLPLVPKDALPPRDGRGRTVWVTRARPKVDRVACPWLIRRFVDPEAVFLYVAADQVALVAERFGAVAFDIPGARWSHDGEYCSFDTMLRGFGLNCPALDRLALVVRGADTNRPDLAPQAAGLLAACLGLSHLYASDLDQLDAAMPIYDAFFRWARDASQESHDWTMPAGGERIGHAR